MMASLIVSFDYLLCFVSRYPPPEYGGMRVDPKNHKRVYKAIVDYGNFIFTQVRLLLTFSCYQLHRFALYMTHVVTILSSIVRRSNLATLQPVWRMVQIVPLRDVVKVF